MRPTAFDVPLYLAAVAAGMVLIALARWAAVRGARWESLVALRVGSVLFTEVVGAFLVGYGAGALVALQLGPSPGGPPRPPVGVGRFRGTGLFAPFDPANLPLTLGMVGSLLATLLRVDLREILSPARTKDPLARYVGWEARVIAPIAAGGYGEVALRDADGNVRAVAATADVDIADGANVAVVGTRDLNLLVAPT